MYKYKSPPIVKKLFDSPNPRILADKIEEDGDHETAQYIREQMDFVDKIKQKVISDIENKVISFKKLPNHFTWMWGTVSVYPYSPNHYVNIIFEAFNIHKEGPNPFDELKIKNWVEQQFYNFGRELAIGVVNCV